MISVRLYRGDMRESEIEQHFIWAVNRAGGKTWKFSSRNVRGVADRIACFPDGTTWFVELKAPDGTMSKLQELFAADMARLNQKYTVLWSKEEVDKWAKSL